MKKIFLIFFLSILMGQARSQVLLSLLFGDKLNTEKMEFGLDGGANFSTLKGLPGAGTRTSFNLGLYFDIRLKDKWLLHTGLIIKSPFGASGLQPYSLDDPALDQVFAGGTVTRKLSYVSIPALARYRFPNKFFLEGGIQAGIRTGATDVFFRKMEDKSEVTNVVRTGSQYHTLDAGLVAGIGYRFMKGRGMNLRLSYYLGLVDVVIDDSSPNQYNRTFYTTLSIPIGASKDKKTGEAQEK